MYMNSPGAYSAIKANAKGFQFGVGMLPYWPDVKGAPQNSIIGGATFWVLRGPCAGCLQGRRQVLPVHELGTRAG